MGVPHMRMSLLSAPHPSRSINKSRACSEISSVASVDLVYVKMQSSAQSEETADANDRFRFMTPGQWMSWAPPPPPHTPSSRHDGNLRFFARASLFSDFTTYFNAILTVFSRVGAAVRKRTNPAWNMRFFRTAHRTFSNWDRTISGILKSI